MDPNFYIFFTTSNLLPLPPLSSTSVWLENDALKNNPKIEIVAGDDGGENKYEFKPAIPVKDRKSLLQYLDKQESEGLGESFGKVLWFWTFGSVCSDGFVWRVGLVWLYETDGVESG